MSYASGSRPAFVRPAYPRQRRMFLCMPHRSLIMCRLGLELGNRSRQDHHQQPLEDGVLRDGILHGHTTGCAGIRPLTMQLDTRDLPKVIKANVFSVVREDGVLMAREGLHGDRLRLDRVGGLSEPLPLSDISARTGHHL
jgi:hypothetical protein